MSLKSIFKGWLGEVQGALVHRLLLDSHVYQALNDVTLPTPDGTTQIDHVLVSRFAAKTAHRQITRYVAWAEGQTLHYSEEILWRSNIRLQPKVLHGNQAL